MLSDLDRLMAERNLDTIIVPMWEAMHPSFRWISRGTKITKGYAVRKRGAEPVIVTYPMEREEAGATGLEVWLAHEFDQQRLFAEAPNGSAGYAEFFTAVLRRAGSGPSIAFFGNAPLQTWLGIPEEMEKRGWTVVRSHGEDLIQLARKRKEPREIEEVRSVGARTVQVVEGVRRILRESVVSGEEVLWKGGPLMIGTLKDFVSQEIYRLGMIEDHETILSQGRDAGVPHSRGDAAAPVRPSQPIVLDIFPVDRVSGYFYDLTRTFCVGPVPDELKKLHADVYAAFCLARDAMKPGTLAQAYQALVCDYFESKGYATLRSDAKTTSGYVHGLGHGVGLDVHEKPGFHILASNRDQVESGDILTIEPGLYFPERRLGVRIEDTFLVTETGVESLSPGGYGLEP